MTLTTTPLGRPFTYDLTEQTVTVKAGDRNVRYGATTLYSVRLDNQEVGAAKAYVKFYDDDGGDLEFDGTELPDVVIPVAADAVMTMEMPGGLAFVNGLSFAGSKEAGKSLTADPDDSVATRLVTG